MRSILVIAMLGAACVRDAMPELPPAQDGVETVVVRDPAPYRIDALFVIEDSPAMQPYAAQLAQGLRANAAGLATNENDVDVHAGVITADVGDERERANTPLPGQCAGWGDAGVFRRSALVDGTHIRYRKIRGDVRANVAGTVGDALASLGDVGTAGCVHARPLEAMRIALDHDPHDGGFRRADAQLAVIIIAASDDDSPRSLDDYAAFLHGLQPNVAVQLAGPASGRLAAFAERFPQRSYVWPLATLAQGELLGQALADLTPGWRVPTGSPCFDGPLADLDEATPGVQPDCTVSEYITGREARLLAACGAGARPCWRIVDDGQCIAAQHLRLDIDRGGEDPPDNDMVEAQCVSS